MRKSTSIGRFLLTGTEAKLTAMVEKVYAFTNPIEHRGDTIFCTAALDGENLTLLLAAARTHGITVQQRDEEAETDPYWLLLHQGELPPWSADL